jgi:very-short-patch-repair endonuclease
MLAKAALAVLTTLGRPTLGVFRGVDAVAGDVNRNQLLAFAAAGVIVRELPDVYRMTVVTTSAEQRLVAALLWAGQDAVAAARSAAEMYGIEGVRAPRPEIVVPSSRFLRSPTVSVERHQNFDELMVRTHRGMRVTGVEATVVALASLLEAEAFEIACEDARRRRLTTVPALRAYLERFARRRMPGVRVTRALLDGLDPIHPARSTLEVKTRRLLVAHGITDFVREFPLTWNGRTYLYDFGFASRRAILETNGRRWHDDPADYEHDHEKWSVPGRLGYRIVLATWTKVTRDPHALLAELTATLAA